MTTAHFTRPNGPLTATSAASSRELRRCYQGDSVEAKTDGDALRILPIEKPRVTLQAIIAAVPDDIHRARQTGWDEMPSAGTEW